MTNTFFNFLRPGINTTIQDLGRNNFYHIGIPFSGAMDKRNFLISNKLVGNLLTMPVIEFAYQGPLLEFFGINLAIIIIYTIIIKVPLNEIMIFLEKDPLKN